MAIPSEFSRFYFSKEIIIYYSCILDFSFAALSLQEMVRSY